jgi:parvulin-like peptidyl-prolyl isomerase
VIRTIFGFHIIKLIDKDLTEKDKSWQDHEMDIKNTLYNRKYEETFKNWMEGLKSKSYVKINY